MKSLGQYPVWLTGSRKTIRRTVRTDGTKYVIKWYGQDIEIKRSTGGLFSTVESY